jgi:hypothetical protein
VSNSKACGAAQTIDAEYKGALSKEFAVLQERLKKPGITKNIRVVLLYVPLADKDGLVTAFDTKLKGLQ